MTFPPAFFFIILYMFLSIVLESDLEVYQSFFWLFYFQFVIGSAFLLDSVILNFPLCFYCFLCSQMMKNVLCNHIENQSIYC